MRKDTGKHYRKEFMGVKLDPARIQLVYEIDHPMQQTVLKKALRAGTAHKTVVEDIDDIICACERWKEMLIEDDENDSI